MKNEVNCIIINNKPSINVFITDVGGMQKTMQQTQKPLNQIKNVCKYILYYAYKLARDDDKAESNITNLWLQKALYYVYGAYYKKHRESLFLPYFEAWQYGPVCPEAYLIYSSNSWKPIPKPLECPVLKIEEKELETINNAIAHCVAQPASFLVDQTHKELPWKKISEDGTRTGVGNVIPENLIHDFFINNPIWWETT